MSKLSHITAKEIAERVGRTRQAILRRAKEEGWVYKEEKCRGGRVRCFDVDQLPRDVSEAVLVRQSEPAGVDEPHASSGDTSRLKLMAMAAEVLDSGSTFEAALAANIKAFYRLIQMQTSTQGLDTRMANVEGSSQEFADTGRRFAELEKENAELKIRLDEHRKAKGHRADFFEESKKSEGT